MLAQRNYLAIARFSNLTTPIDQPEVCFPAQCDSISRRCVTKWGTVLDCDGGVGTILANETAYTCGFGPVGAVPAINMTSALASKLLNDTVTVPTTLGGCNNYAINSTSCASTDRTQTCAWVNLMPRCATDACCDRLVCDEDCGASTKRWTRNWIPVECDNTPRNLGRADAYICNCDGPVNALGAEVVSPLVSNLTAINSEGCPNNASQTLVPYQQRLAPFADPDGTVDLSAVLLGGGSAAQASRRSGASVTSGAWYLR